MEPGAGRDLWIIYFKQKKFIARIEKGRCLHEQTNQSILRIISWNPFVSSDVPIFPVPILLVLHTDYCPPQSNIAKSPCSLNYISCKMKLTIHWTIHHPTSYFRPPHHTTIIIRQSIFVILSNGCSRGCFFKKSWNWSKSNRESCINWIWDVVAIVCMI